jgi:hypothetical protein
MTVDVGDQDMKAHVMLTAPGPGVRLAADSILSFLRNNKVIYGLKEDVLQELEDSPRYREPILVAEGARPQNGQDASIQFNFEVDKTQIHLKESSDGRVNFKELGLIQNVVAGQPLARKIPAQNAIPGRTVTGKILPARNGKDIPMPLGKNVRVADDGVTILAEINGQVTYLGGRSTSRRSSRSRGREPEDGERNVPWNGDRPGECGGRIHREGFRQRGKSTATSENANWSRKGTSSSTRASRGNPGALSRRKERVGEIHREREGGSG